MIELKTSDLKNLKEIDSGKFGTVFKKDDTTAYKIYHPLVAEDLTGIAVDNPALMLPRWHFYSLINRSKHLKYSGGVTDIIRLDGKFGGVCIPFVDGVNLVKLIDSPIKLKIGLSKQMIRNAKELNKHLIYTTDYKLNNTMLSHSRVELIDLDDSRTHVYYTPSVIIRSLSINSLAETIQRFFLQFEHYGIDDKIRLKRHKAFSAVTYKKIEEYLRYKEIERKILFIDEDTDLEEAKRLSNDYSFDLVYVGKEADSKEKLDSDAKRLVEVEIPLFDVTKTNLVDEYHTLEHMKEAYNLDKDKQLVKVYKRDS